MRYPELLYEVLYLTLVFVGAPLRFSLTASCLVARVAARLESALYCTVLYRTVGRYLLMRGKYVCKVCLLEG